MSQDVFGAFEGGTRKLYQIMNNKIEIAVFASGCFWGTEHYLKKASGVIETTVGYTGENVPNPTYEQVLSGETRHKEAVEVVYDSGKISYKDLAKLFFETHDFTQVGGQGPDIGDQYQSVIFYKDEEQKDIAEDLILELEEKGYSVATKIEPAGVFYKAEEHHQNYYSETGSSPYCHIYRKIF